VKVVTLNLWNVNEPLEARMVAIIESLSGLDADVIGLQEVAQTASIPNQAETIGAALGLHVAVHPQPMRNGKGGDCTGTAILSRFPVTSCKWLPLPVSDNVRGVECAVLRHPLGALQVFCTHLNCRPDDHDRRGKQVLALDDMVGASPGDMPKIVIGDFNAEPESEEIRFLTGRSSLEGRRVCYLDAYAAGNGGEVVNSAGATWSDANPFAAPSGQGNRRIDYIFLSGRLRGEGVDRVRSARVVCDRAGSNGVFPSDHFGVLADLDFDGSWT
jgi:endonuclease/exonuclease/phosphatase family metal-dependent hydrolase